MKKTVLKRITALAVCVLLTVSVLGSEASAFFNLPAQIIAGGGLLYTNAQNSAGDYQINTISGETQNVQDRVSDSDTMDTYIDKLLTNEMGSRYAGRVWTDKSVFAYGEGQNIITLNMESDGYDGNVTYNADFGHVYSALASSQVVNEYPPSPIDMVLVLDISSSMGDVTTPEVEPYKTLAAQGAIKHTRLLNLVYSADNVIKQLMNDNPENRVSVVVYDRRATVIMPLAHYTANTKAVSEIKPSDSNYVYDSGHLNDDEKDDPGGVHKNATAHEALKDLVFGYLCPYFDGHGDEPVTVSQFRVVATPTDTKDAAGNTVVTHDVTYSDVLRISGTNTHAGLTAGMEQLANAKETTFTDKLSNGQKSTVARIPAVVVMTDGGSNTVANGPWYDPDYATPVQRSDHKNDWSSVVVTQYLMTAAYLKSAIENNYSAYMSIGENPDLPVYTVGVDLRDDSDDWVPARLFPMMDPATYFKSESEIPQAAKHPDGSSIALGSDNKNKELISNAFENWNKWTQNNGLVTDNFSVSDTKEKTHGRFQQQEKDCNEYIIPFEQDNENIPDAGELQSWHGDLGNFPYDLQYNTAWHGWGDFSNPNNIGSFSSDITGVATFWSFEQAQATNTTAYQAGGNTYQADYLATRKIKYNDVKGSTNDELDSKTREVAAVTQADMISNINYVTKFYDVSSSEMDKIFTDILAEVLGKVFVPVSGDNDAGVGDSITYQDPIGKYMEIKNQSIVASPSHTDGSVESKPTTYDMAALLFGEMHGLVRTGIYDYQWNDAYMGEHRKEEQGKASFPQGWYRGEPETAEEGGAGNVPTTTEKTYTDPAEAWADDWVYRINNNTLAQYVPIVQKPDSPGELTEQAQKTVYTIYRFACTADERNALRRNPVYGTVPADLQSTWNNATDEQKATDELYRDVPGVYRLSDIRVWQEHTGNYVDIEGSITPENAGYDDSLYVNLPAAAVPTQVAEITLGPDGVLSYKTNRGVDHKEGTSDVDENGDEITVTKEMYNNYCYQSTPFRLFYAVGVAEDLIQRDAGGHQTGVDIAKLPQEYISSHTGANGNVYFYSNYYSNTNYDGYISDTQASRTRGDPTVTFAPSTDNRYYVFQKPLPLYAHAYRVKDGKISLVDRTDGQSWTGDRGGNGSTTWESVDGVQQNGGTWAGGQFMGVYKDNASFETAFAASKSAGNIIIDETDTKYPVVENGIVFLQEDLLDHVTSNPDGEGYKSGSKSFSSDDYFFILVEYYVPDGGVGVDTRDKEIPGTQKAHAVQYAVARKGSEFGSGFVSKNITNGEMLCWTDVNNRIDLNINYLSRSETGDDTRGEPTFEKLTYTESTPTKLSDYLRDTCHIKPDELDDQVGYWLGLQNDPSVKAALEAAKNAETSDKNDELSEAEFNAYFKFAVAARPGGIRSGDMANNRQSKDPNTTETAYNYYLPTVSEDSGTGRDIILNTYLGNNGRLTVSNNPLLVTKTLVAPSGLTLTAEQLAKNFEFKITASGDVGEKTAQLVMYNAYSGKWQKRVSSIDVSLDNSDLLLDKSNKRAYFVNEDGVLKQVIKAEDGSYYYADNKGDITTAQCEETAIYYLYIKPAHAATGEDVNSLTIYKYDGKDIVAHDYSGRTIYVADESQLAGATDSDARELATETTPAGTISYWVKDPILIPIAEVDGFENGASEHVPGAYALDTFDSGASYWQYVEGETNGEEFKGKLTLVVRLPIEDSLESEYLAPYNTVTTFRTETLTFDENNTATFYLKSGDGLLINGLNPKFTYTIKEVLSEADEANGYKIESVTFTDPLTEAKSSKSNPVTGISSGQLDFVNTFETAPLKVTKHLDPPEVNDDTKFSFTLELTLPEWQKRTDADLIAPEGSDVPSVFEPFTLHYVINKGPEQTANLTIDADKYVKDQDGTDTADLNDGYGRKLSAFTFTLSKDDSIVFKDLPIGTDYTVTEAETDNYEPDGKQYSKTGTIAKEVEASEGVKEVKNEEIFTNIRIYPASIEISKTVKYAGDVDYALSEELENKAFSFTVTLTPAVGNTLKGREAKEGEKPLNENSVRYDAIVAAADGTSTTTYIDLTNNGGVYTGDFTLKHGETYKIIGLPNSFDIDYKVAETDSKGLTSSADATGTIKARGTQEAVAVKVGFTNTAPSPTEVDLIKTVTVEAGTYGGIKAGDFTFTVKPVEGNPDDDPVPAGGLTVSNEAADAEAPYEVTIQLFKDLAFKTAGVYNYTVSEAPSNIPGIINDGTTYTVTVVIAPDKADSSKLTAEVTITNGNVKVDHLVFNNTYDITKAVANIEAKKLLDDDIPDREFKFKLEPKDGAPMPEGAETALTAIASPEDGIARFEQITYDKIGTYKYRLTEDIPTAPNDIEYDTTEYEVTVEVTADENNALVATVTYAKVVGDESAGSFEKLPVGEIPTFNNKTRTGSLTVTKTVTGEGSTDKEFNFTVSFPATTNMSKVTAVKHTAEGETTLASKFDEFGDQKRLSFKLKHDESLTISGIPYGTRYEVTEADYSDEGYTTTFTVNGNTVETATGTIDTSTPSVTVAYVNTYNTGSITVTKTVTGEGGDQEKEFNFTLTIPATIDTSKVTVTKAPASEGDNTEYTFKSGVLGFTLKHGETLKVSGLPIGTEYEVVETDANKAGYTATVTVNDEPVETAKGTISGEDLDITVAYVNTYNTGSLTVSKKVEGEGAPDKAFHFTLTLENEDIAGTALKVKIDGVDVDVKGENGKFTHEFTLKHNQSVTVTGIPYGTRYEVTEADYRSEGYTTTVDGEATGTIDASMPSVTVAFTNSYHTGALSVTKVLEAAEGAELTGADNDVEFTFTLTLTPPEGSYLDNVTFDRDVEEAPVESTESEDDKAYTFKLKAGETVNVSGIPYGTRYELTETPTAGYESPKAIENSTGTIDKDQTKVEITVTNTKPATTPVSLPIVGEKVFKYEGTDEEIALEAGQFSFKITESEGAPKPERSEAANDVNGKIDFGSIKFIEAGTYTYTVSEVAPTETDGITYDAKSYTIEVEVTEQVSGSTRKLAIKSVTVSDKNGDKKVDLTKDQIDLGIVFTNTMPKPKLAEIIVSKALGEDVPDKFENRDPWEFKFQITFKNENDEAATDLCDPTGKVHGIPINEKGVGTFTLSLTYAAQITITGIPVGYSYDLEEIDAKGLEPTYSENHIGTIGDNTSPITVYVTNNNPAPTVASLTVLKYVKDGDSLVTDDATRFNFTLQLTDKDGKPLGEDAYKYTGEAEFVNDMLSFTLAHGESLTLTDLPDGTKYVIREIPTDGYVSDIPADGFTGTVDVATGPINISVPVTNTVVHPAGSLSVTKYVTGTGDINKEFHIKVTLSDATVNGAYGEMTFVNGVANFTICHNETVTATGLPAGITYEVTEAEANTDGYTTTYTGEIGTIPANGTVEATITNDLTPPPPPTEEYGGLSVTKYVTGTGDITKDFNITVTLSDATVNGQYGEMNFVDGVANFTIHHDETVTATGLPAGITYTVVEAEANADGYTTTYTGQTGTIPVNGMAEAVITNDLSETPPPPPTEEYGGLSVTKYVTGTGDTTKDFHITVTLSDVTINGQYGEMTFENGVANFTIHHNETVTATGLPAGITYTVVEAEANADGYVTTYTGQTGTIPANGTAEAVITNDLSETPPPPPPTEEYGNLAVSKTVQSDDPADYMRSYSFTVTLSEPLTGQYGDMYFSGGTAFITLTAGQTLTASGLPAGITYSVYENDGFGFTVLVNGMPTGSASGIILSGSTQFAAFTNIKELPEPMYGSLTVTKTVTGSAGDLNKDFTFTVTLSEPLTGQYGGMYFSGGTAVFTLRHGESRTASGLPEGISYWVTETDNEGYTVESYGSTGFITANGNAVADFVNTKDQPDEPDEPDEPENPDEPEEPLGGLTVAKFVTGFGIDYQDFTFTVTLSEPLSGQYGEMTFSGGVATFTLRHGQTKSASGLPAGISYSVTESNNQYYVVTANGADGVIVGGGSASCEYINYLTEEDRPKVLQLLDDMTPLIDFNPKTGGGYVSKIGISGLLLIVSSLAVIASKRRGR